MTNRVRQRAAVTLEDLEVVRKLGRGEGAAATLDAWRRLEDAGYVSVGSWMVTPAGHRAASARWSLGTTTGPIELDSVGITTIGIDHLQDDGTTWYSKIEVHSMDHKEAQTIVDRIIAHLNGR